MVRAHHSSLAAAVGSARVGTLRVGTSGFSYRPWSPAFYPAALRPDAMLAYYAERLPAVELNSTYYQHPQAERIEGWLRQTPDGFRFCVKSHRFASARAFATDPTGTVPRLTGFLRPFGDRLGAVLFRVAEQQVRDDDRLVRFLAAWPRQLPLAIEFQHDSWWVADVQEQLRAVAAAICLTDRDDRDEPDPVVTGSFAYLRLRREDYSAGSLDRWADRLAGILEGGRDAYVFFRHDPTGLAPGRALMLARRVAVRMGG